MATHKIQGLSAVGYTAQTIALAEVIVRNITVRDKIRRILDELDTPTRYSNQDFDRKQQLALYLAELMRCADLKPID